MPITLTNYQKATDEELQAFLEEKGQDPSKKEGEIYPKYRARLVKMAGEILGPMPAAARPQLPKTPSVQALPKELPKELPKRPDSTAKQQQPPALPAKRPDLSKTASSSTAGRVPPLPPKPAPQQTSASAPRPNLPPRPTIDKATSSSALLSQSDPEYKGKRAINELYETEFNHLVFLKVWMLLLHDGQFKTSFAGKTDLINAIDKYVQLTMDGMTNALALSETDKAELIALMEKSAGALLEQHKIERDLAIEKDPEIVAKKFTEMGEAKKVVASAQGELQKFLEARLQATNYSQDLFGKTTQFFKSSTFFLAINSLAKLVADFDNNPGRSDDALVFNDYRIKPAQRVMKYQLLAKEIVGNAEKFVDAGKQSLVKKFGEGISKVGGILGHYYDIGYFNVSNLAEDANVAKYFGRLREGKKAKEYEGLPSLEDIEKIISAYFTAGAEATFDPMLMVKAAKIDSFYEAKVVTKCSPDASDTDKKAAFTAALREDLISQQLLFKTLSPKKERAINILASSLYDVHNIYGAHQDRSALNQMAGMLRRHGTALSEPETITSPSPSPKTPFMRAKEVTGALKSSVAGGASDAASKAVDAARKARKSIFKPGKQRSGDDDEDIL